MNNNPRTDCPMCGFKDDYGTTYGPNEVCNHCYNDLYNDEWEHHSSYTTDEGDEDE